MKSTDKMIGAREAADRLQVSRPTLTRWVQSGKIGALYKGSGMRGAYVFAESEVERKCAERAS